MKPVANPSRSSLATWRQAALGSLWLALAAGYLAASASGLRVVAMVIVGLMVGAFLVACGKITLGMITGAALAILCLYFSDSLQFFVYVPPLAAFAFMALFFYRTLLPGSEPLITRVARKEHPDLPPEMARYARRLTGTWSLCFMLLFAVALLLAPLLAIDVWSRWVHGLGYVMPLGLFLGECAYRRHRFPDRYHGSLRVLIPNIVAVSREIALSSANREGDPGR